MLSDEDKREIKSMFEKLKEELKDTFAQVPESGKSLPNVSEIGDKVFFIKDNTLYISNNGAWKKVADLT